MQNECSLWTRGLEREILPTARTLGVALVAYSPLGRGLLTGALTSPDSLAADDIRRDSPASARRISRPTPASSRAYANSPPTAAALPPSRRPSPAPSSSHQRPLRAAPRRPADAWPPTWPSRAHARTVPITAHSSAAAPRREAGVETLDGAPPSRSGALLCAAETRSEAWPATRAGTDRVAALRTRTRTRPRWRLLVHSFLMSVGGERAAGHFMRRGT
ncbi:aldo/keto reductase [Streptomyces sp. NPDC059593]|uniref:aldo/keto reductase n=1 Tax=Streptomyces sp. NPDC059593 TaxID=3346878 RepID=UPI00369B5B37